MINFNDCQFHEYIFRSIRSQTFFKIGALKNFAILKIKKELQHKYFPVRSSHVMLTQRQLSFSKCWDSDFISLYLFLKNWSIPQHISACSVRINFSNCNRQNQSSLASYTFLQEMLISIKTRHFHSCNNQQEHLFFRKRITSYFRPVNIAKFLRTVFYRTPPETVVCRCSSKQVFLKVSQSSQ